VQLDKNKVLHEINIFQQIRHEKLIEFYHFWIDEVQNQVVFITELMPSGTLKEYVSPITLSHQSTKQIKLTQQHPKSPDTLKSLQK
jgi:serine/threonine protein kinase